MSGLVEAIAVEISDREQRRVSLTSEIDAIDVQLEQLHTMHQAATILAGEGTVEEPKPAGASRTSAKSGGRSLSPGRNGGKAPGGRRSPNASGKRQPGSAPSGTPAPARSSSSTSSEGGGSKRAAVLAFVQAANGPVKRADIAAALNMTGSAAGQHLTALVADGTIQAQGATSSRVYLATDRADQAAATSGHSKTTGTTTPLPNLKRRVTEAISVDQGALTEERLALALDVDREDVAIACGELIDSGHIELQADATYITGRGGGGKPVSPTDTAARILTALANCDSAWTAGEAAYQASKDGHGEIKTAAAEVALAGLYAEGKVAKFTGAGGSKTTWRAAE